MMQRCVQRRDRGFALLLVFAMAAAAAITLYMEMPRAVFESARNKEELLAERANEYKIAIRRYFVKTKTLPQSIEQLENTNGVRFLRRKYKDPMTGEDEWRLIHWGPGGYTDSKVFKPKQEEKEKRQSSIGEGYQVGGGNAVDLQGEKGIQDIALRQRATDKLPDPQQGQATDGEPIDPNAPPPAPGSAPVQPPSIPGQPPAFGQTPGAPQSPPPSANPGNPQYPGQNFQPGSPFPMAGQPATQPPPVPGQPQPVLGQQAPTGQQNQAALDLIRNILTNPRQSTGQPGGALGGTNQPAATIVTGIAGVASKYKGEGIKRFHERSKIEEWEFLFDPAEQQKKAAGAAASAAGAGGNANPAMGTSPAGSNPTGSPSFGTGSFTPGPGATGVRRVP
jgi:hypothetical protein